jgi:hypothetical protein
MCCFWFRQALPSCPNKCVGNVWYFNGQPVCTAESGASCSYSTITCSFGCDPDTGCISGPGPGECDDHGDCGSGERCCGQTGQCISSSSYGPECDRGDWATYSWCYTGTYCSGETWCCGQYYCSNVCQKAFADNCCDNYCCLTNNKRGHRVCSNGECTGCVEASCVNHWCGAVCSSGATQSCTKSCTYKKCVGSSCDSTTESVSGTKTCQSDCTWGTCVATCPSDECSTDSDCITPPICGDGEVNPDIGEQCDPPATNSTQCPQTTYTCDYENRKLCTRDSYGDCDSSCQCVNDRFSCGPADSGYYCGTCPNHCGDGSCNCNETYSSCPSDCEFECECSGWISHSCGYSSCPWYKIGQTRSCSPSECDSEFQCECSESCCTSWTAQGCGQGGCPDEEMYYTRNCGTCPYSESQCVLHPVCAAPVQCTSSLGNKYNPGEWCCHDERCAIGDSFCYHCPNDVLNCYECQSNGSWIDRCADGTVGYDYECSGKYIGDSCNGGTCESPCVCYIPITYSLSLSASPTRVQYGDLISLTATLRQNGSPLQGKTIEIHYKNPSDGSFLPLVGIGPTNSSGVASYSQGVDSSWFRDSTCQLKAIYSDTESNVVSLTRCECTSGVCCDGCHYRSSSYVCDPEYDVQYGCPWGTSCGDDVGVRYKQRYCSGNSASCTGSISSWTPWAVADYCSSTETCQEGNPNCVSCSVPVQCTSSLGNKYNPGEWCCHDERCAIGNSFCWHCPNDVLNCYECQSDGSWIDRCADGTVDYDYECSGKYIDPAHGDNTCNGGTCESPCVCVLPSIYTLSVSKSGTGSGTVTGNGINCGSDCSETYTADTPVTLSASPDGGSTFAGWSGDCSGTGSCVLTMNSDKSVTATFNISAPGCPSTPSSYPTGQWNRVWCDMNFNIKLADAPNQPNLQFDDNWGGGTVGGIQPNDIGFRSGRKINLEAGNYTFYLGSDDGSRLWIDGELCIDNWGDHGHEELNCTKIYTSSETHDFRIDYYENGGDARVNFYYTSIPLNQPPSAVNLNVAQGDYCFAPYPPVILSWQFSDPDSGDYQSAYQVQVDNNSNFSSPEKDTGKVSSSSTSYAPIGLSYNTTYYWRVRVWDNHDNQSDWSVGDSFTTVVHAYPDTDFTWAPSYPTSEELIQFTDQTTYYNGASGWSWDFGDEGTSSLQNPSHSYSSNGRYTVSFTACDDIGCCTREKEIIISLPLPEWEEISPF